MAYQKMKPCPRCGSADFLAVYTYESGSRYVECDSESCMGFYRGPGATSIRYAIKFHNQKAASHDRRTAPAISR